MSAFRKQNKKSARTRHRAPTALILHGLDEAATTSGLFLHISHHTSCVDWIIRNIH